MKSLAVALVAAILVVSVGVMARITHPATGRATLGGETALLRAGHQVTYSHAEGSAIR